MTKSMTIVGLLMLAMSLGFTGCASAPDIPGVRGSADADPCGRLLLEGAVRDIPVGFGYVLDADGARLRPAEPCPETESEGPETPPASAPPTEGKPTSSHHFDGGHRAEALSDRPPAIVWQAPEPHARGAHAASLRLLWRYGEVVRV